MNKIGIHMLVYTPTWDETSARIVFERAAAHGIDLVEVLIFNPADTDTQLTARLSAEYGIGVTVGICGALDADISSADPAISAAGEALIAAAIPVARDMGATMIGGPTYSALHRYPGPPQGDAVQRAIQVYGRLATIGSRAGVRIGLEPLNRYESNFINTLAQAAEIARTTDPKTIFVHGDVFHMNIEEDELGAALIDVADVLGYLHVTESNRGIMGRGNYNWNRFFQAVVQADYRGPITYESFSPAVVGPELSSLLALWRQPWTDPEQVVPGAIDFIRNGLAAGALSSRRVPV